MNTRTGRPGHRRSPGTFPQPGADHEGRPREHGSTRDPDIVAVHRWIPHGKHFGFGEKIVKCINF